MKPFALLSLALAGVLTGFAGNASANLVLNGNFEAPVISNPSFSTFTTIPGWTTSFGPGIEIQRNVAGSPFEGQQFVELDSSANSGMYQDLSTVVGQAYQLSFAYSARPGIAATSTGIDVFWGGAPVVGLAASGVGLVDTAWTVLTFNLTATSTTTRLEFDAVGTSDSYGGYLDAVSVNAVPEPSSMAMCGIAGLVGLGLARRRRNRAS